MSFKVRKIPSHVDDVNTQMTKTKMFLLFPPNSFLLKKNPSSLSFNIVTFLVFSLQDSVCRTYERCIYGLIMCTGVIQDAVLSPLLLNIITDELKSKYGRSGIIQFADNVAMVSQLKKIERFGKLKK